MKKIIVVAAIALMSATPVVAMDWEDALAAFKAHDYPRAFRLLKPYTDKGNAYAQKPIGDCKGRGLGKCLYYLAV